MTGEAFAGHAPLWPRTSGNTAREARSGTRGLHGVTAEGLSMGTAAMLLRKGAGPALSRTRRPGELDRGLDSLPRAALIRARRVWPTTPTPNPQQILSESSGSLTRVSMGFGEATHQRRQGAHP